MKRFFLFVSIAAVISIILTACAPVTTEPGVTAVPGATEPVGTLVPIDLAGPLMQVGSKYPYVDGTLLAAVPGGSFTMGNNGEDNPIHDVTLSDFWIYSTEVTNQQYDLCVQAGKCSPPNAENNILYGNYRYINFPVTGVDYAQASDYCSFVHGRLPTEAEWEKTARGPEANIFPWGDKAPSCDLLNFDFCVGSASAINDYKDGVSYYGVFDMAGNTREWVSDWYSPAYYSETPVEDPLGPQLGEKRSVRGSSFQDDGGSSISARRFALDPLENLPDVGFRCTVEDPTYFAPMCQELPYIGTGPNGEEASCIPEVKCNDVSVTVNAICSRSLQPYTIVTFGLADTPPDGWTYDVPGCNKLANQNKFECIPPGDFTASVTGSCMDAKGCESACPSGYAKDGDACKWIGVGAVGTECIAGTTYDPLTQCCSATPGTAVDFNICPAGLYPLNGVCVQNPNKLAEINFQDVPFISSCTKPDSGDEPVIPNTAATSSACTLTCGSCEILDSSSCTCNPDPDPSCNPTVP